MNHLLKAWVQQRRPKTLHLPEYRAAAVLVALTAEPEPKVLLTVRSQHLRTHKGQISFPGGSIDAGESVQEAALREAWEEVGLAPHAVEVFGQLDDTFSPAGFHVSPILARIPHDYSFKLTEAEVAEVLLVPLPELRAITPHREARTAHGHQYHIYSYPWRGYTIWGMTAGILHGLLQGLD